MELIVSKVGWPTGAGPSGEDTPGASPANAAAFNGRLLDYAFGSVSGAASSGSGGAGTSAGAGAGPAKGGPPAHPAASVARLP